jgi:hypothetical protein
LVDNPVPGNFEFIKTSFLKAVLEGADSGKGGAERGGPGFGKGVARGGAEREGAKAGGDARDGGGSDKPAGPDRSGWTPLGDLAQQGFGGGGGGVGPAAGKAPAGDDRRGGGVAPPRDQAQANKPKPKGDFQRAEFVVFFVWKEPTPSEKDAENAATPATPEAAPPIK